MRILVLANDSAWNELVAGNAVVDWVRAENAGDFRFKNDMDAYFDLTESACEKDYASFSKIIFIHSVNKTLKQFGANKNIFRINAWCGFLQRDQWEIAGDINDECIAVFNAMNRKPIAVADEPGFIASRIIAMIINEAYFAKAEEVSTEQEIDTAMKLGTNYPYGPFEWCERIGAKNIYSLLETLSINDFRYKPSDLLAQASNQ